VKKLLLFGIFLALSLAGCGDKNKLGKAPAGSAASSPGKNVASAPATPSSIAGHINEYHMFDFGQPVDFSGFMRFREEFMRMAAADPKVDAKKLGEMAIVEIGSETDGFKREDLIKKNADRVADIRKNAIPKAFIADSRPQGMTATISPYDMDKEIYVVTLRVDSFSIGYGWQQNSTYYDYRLIMETPSFSGRHTCFECSKDVDVVVKIPKDRARKVEESLAPFREQSSLRAIVPAAYYVSVSRTDESSLWNNATVRVNLDAVALRLPRQPVGATLILIDGPELTPKT
jgi:hypothetical protein